MTSIGRRLDVLEKKYGKGATYGRGEQELILDGVPEWLFRGRLLLKGDLRDRCDKAIRSLRELVDAGKFDGEQKTKALERLKPLHAAVWPQVAD
jgi:hypothetical protein